MAVTIGQLYTVKKIKALQIGLTSSTRPCHVKPGETANISTIPRTGTVKQYIIYIRADNRSNNHWWGEMEPVKFDNYCVFFLDNRTEQSDALLIVLTQC